MLSNDYVRNYYYQLAEDTSEETRLDIQDKVSEVNNERLKFLISHRISFVYDYNVNNIDCYEEIHKKLHNNSVKQIKIRIHSDDNYNIKSIHDRKTDYQNKDKEIMLFMLVTLVKKFIGKLNKEKRLLWMIVGLIM